MMGEGRTRARSLLFLVALGTEERDGRRRTILRGRRRADIISVCVSLLREEKEEGVIGTDKDLRPLDEIICLSKGHQIQHET